MHIQIVGLHAPNAPRLRALLGDAHEVQALLSFPPQGAIEADVVISNRISADEAARLRCRLVQVPGAGWEQVACQALPSGTAVCNVYGHEIPIAEFTLHALLEHWLQPWQYPARLDGPAWAQAYAARPPHDEAFGKTIAILGFGRIGQEIARRARACGMRVIAITRSGRLPDAALADECVAVARLDEALPRAQALVVCCPLDDGTRGLIGAAQLALLPAQALLVNVARAEVVDEQALYDALRTRRLGRAALDVWYQYPQSGQSGGDPVPPSRWPLHALDNVRATPHISAITPALLERRYAFMAANIERLGTGEALENLVYQAP